MVVFSVSPSQQQLLVALSTFQIVVGFLPVTSLFLDFTVSSSPAIVACSVLA